jgi:hypothetical protein
MFAALSSTSSFMVNRGLPKQQRAFQDKHLAQQGMLLRHVQQHCQYH